MAESKNWENSPGWSTRGEQPANIGILMYKTKRVTMGNTWQNHQQSIYGLGNTSTVQQFHTTSYNHKSWRVGSTMASLHHLRVCAHGFVGCPLEPGQWGTRIHWIGFLGTILTGNHAFPYQISEKILVSSPLKPIQQIWRIHTLQVQLEVPLCRASMRPFNLRWVLSGVPWASPSWDEALRRQRQRPHQTSRDVYCI